MENQTHGKTAKNNDNQTKTQTKDKKLLRRKAGILNQARLRPHNTGLRPSAIEGKIINTLIRLKNSWLAEVSLRTISYSLKRLARNCNLNNSEAAKQFIANKVTVRASY